MYGHHINIVAVRIGKELLVFVFFILGQMGKNNQAHHTFHVFSHQVVPVGIKIQAQNVVR